LVRVAVVGIVVSVAGALPSALMALGAMEPGVVEGGLLFGLQVLTGVAGGAGYAAAFTLLAIVLERRKGPLTRAIAAMGQRSLTFYILNSVLVAVILQPDLVGLGPSLGGFGALVTAALVWGVSLALATWLDRTGRPGPLDALMRKCVYAGRSRAGG